MFGKGVAEVLVTTCESRWSLLWGGKHAGVAQDSWGSRVGMDSGKALHLKIWSQNSALSGGRVWTRTRMKIVQGKSKGIDAGWQLAE